LIFPEPCQFISSSLPACSVIRPTLDQNAGAVAAVKALTDDQLSRVSHRSSSAHSWAWQRRLTLRSARSP